MLLFPSVTAEGKLGLLTVSSRGWTGMIVFATSDGVRVVPVVVVNGLIQGVLF